MNISAGAQGSDQVVDLEAGEDPPEFLRQSSPDPEVTQDVVIAVSSDDGSEWNCCFTNRSPEYP